MNSSTASTMPEEAVDALLAQVTRVTSVTSAPRLRADELAVVPSGE